MKKARLRKLAKFLRENVKDSWFDLEDWASPGWEDKECGTTACAMGWATVVFRGLEMNNGWPCVVGRQTDDGWNIGGFEAAEMFFDITGQDALFLFDPGSYSEGRRGRRAVAARIEKFIGDR